MDIKVLKKHFKTRLKGLGNTLGEEIQRLKDKLCLHLLNIKELEKENKQLREKITFAIQELKEFGSIEAVKELERE